MTRGWWNAKRLKAWINLKVLEGFFVSLLFCLPFSFLPLRFCIFYFMRKLKSQKVFLRSELQLLNGILLFVTFGLWERGSVRVKDTETERKKKRWPVRLSVHVHALWLHVLCGSHQPVMQARPQQDEKCLQCTRRQEKVTLNLHIQAENLMLSWYASYGGKKK